MKKIILITIACLSMAALHAQPWMKGYENKPVKLSEIVAQYERNKGNAAEEEEEERELKRGKVVREGHNYQFDRWRNYWELHLDEQGYLVSPVKTWQAWRAYLAQYKPIKGLQKGTANQAQWTFAGPATSPGGYAGVGRIQAMAFHPTNPGIYWVGCGGGGAWKTTNDGATWTCTTDGLPVLGVSDIAYNPKNPNTIYLCTGDRDAGDSHSIGLLKSYDGGTTWDTTGLQWVVQDARFLNAIVVNKLDSNSLTVATSNGIYKSRDGGGTWTLQQGGNFQHLMYAAVDTNILFATTNQGGSLYRSANGGNTWAAVTNLTAVEHMVAAVTAANPAIVKFVGSNSNNGLEGIYTSSDTGKTFTKVFGGLPCTNNILSGDLTLTVGSCSGQAWYDLTMAISPQDANLVVVGGINTYYSANGGSNWQIATQWYGGLPGVKTVHADKHFHAYQPTRPGVLFEGNDGGVYKTSSPVAGIWNDLTNGLGITQFYRNATTNMTSFVLGGAQDNGSKKIDNGVYTELTGGDGMNCEIDYSDPGTYYTAYQYGSIDITTDGGANFNSISDNIPGQPEGDWITPYVLHPVIPSFLFAGYKKVYFSQDQGQTWDSISPVFIAGRNITRLIIAPSDPNNTLYAVVNSPTASTIRATYDFGQSWGTIPLPFTAYISDIAVMPNDRKHLWVTFSGYGTNKVAEYDSVNGWRIRNDQLPDIPVNCILIDTSSYAKYLGTDVGVFYRDTTMSQWILYNDGLPAAQVRDLGINYTSGEIWAATYGRGMWKSLKRDDGSQGPNGVSMIPLAMDVISIAPNPNKGRFTIHTGNKGFINRPVQVHMINSLGSIAWQQSNLTFDAGGDLVVAADGLARGTYIVEVFGGNGMTAKKKVVVY